VYDHIILKNSSAQHQSPDDKSAAEAMVGLDTPDEARHLLTRKKLYISVFSNIFINITVNFDF
jgi:hypothetical protein